MKQLLSFIKKEFFHILRDKRTMIILFGIPIAQILLFGYVITNEIKNVKVAVLDLSKDNVTAEIINKITASGFFTLNKNIQTEKDIPLTFKEGKIREVIIFEPDFAKKLQKENFADIQLIADASDANSANMIVNYTSGVIMNYLAKLNKNADIPLKINVNERMVYNEALKDVYMFIPGTMAMILMLISAMMTSIAVTREKELGTMEILLVSPLKPLHILIGKVTPYLALSFVISMIIIAIGNIIFGMPVLGSLSLLLAETMLYILLALSLGILISTVAKNQQSAMMLSLFALLLPTILLSGFIFPIENMPKVLQWLAALMPPKYFIIILKNIMIKGTGFTYVWKETLILSGMTVFFLGLSAKKFKIRLE
ncbi:MAG: ABC transporter permease [Bacteroidales bacterium]|nr:ABC transporter permease [Bacteroidales bacterium]